MALQDLTDRERDILEAVIELYVETAQPAGSQELARRYNFGLSSATIRNTMSDLEDKGYLYHPHTSAGRVPTDAAYRYYVDSVLAERTAEFPEQNQLTAEISSPPRAVTREALIRRAAHSLSVIARELGVALKPDYSENHVSDSEPHPDVVVGRPSVLVEQPEFASANSLRQLVVLMETPENLGGLLRKRAGTSGLSVTIGGENEDPEFSNFTVVTAQYFAGPLSGVIGVIGPTRMPYRRVISLVSHTSRVVSDLLH